MTATPTAAGALVDNIVRFARLLRAAGVPVGPGQVVAAVDALSEIGLAGRNDVYWTLHAALVSRREQHELFDQAFAAFWRDSGRRDPAIAGLLPRLTDPTASAALRRRIVDALRGEREAAASDHPSEPERRLDAVLTWSDREVLNTKDFEAMSAEEEQAVKDALARLALPVAPVPTRRYRPDAAGDAVDWRASLRAAGRRGGDGWLICRRSRRRRPPPIVVLCDISGSMDRYARVLLHFLHALRRSGERLSVFLFGTRLTNVTRAFASRDIDDALTGVAALVPDWAGGTRIGACIAAFNRLWSRRVLAEGAVVVLVTDGLDRDLGRDLGTEMARLRRSCRRLIWLNPLLRYARFEARAHGIRAILPHVDEFRPVHNMESLHALVTALNGPAPRRRFNVAQAGMRG